RTSHHVDAFRCTGISTWLSPPSLHGHCGQAIRARRLASPKAARVPQAARRRRPAEHSDELAPFHSITLSARNRNDSGILWLELRGFGNKLAELITRVTTHSRGPRIA